MDKERYAKEIVNKLVEVPPEIVFDMYAGRWDHQCEIKIREFIVKCNSEKGDFVADGTKDIVLGNITQEIIGTGYMVFFVEQPFPVFIHGTRVKKVNHYNWNRG